MGALRLRLIAVTACRPCSISSSISWHPESLSFSRLQRVSSYHPLAACHWLCDNAFSGFSESSMTMMSAPRPVSSRRPKWRRASRALSSRTRVPRDAAGSRPSGRAETPPRKGDRRQMRLQIARRQAQDQAADMAPAHRGKLCDDERASACANADPHSPHKCKYRHGFGSLCCFSRLTIAG